MQTMDCVFLSTDAVAFSNAHFGAGIGTIHLHVVGCTGREANLTDCPETRSSAYCLRSHSTDAGVRCQGWKEGCNIQLYLTDNQLYLNEGEYNNVL